MIVAMVSLLAFSVVAGDHDPDPTWSTDDDSFIANVEHTDLGHHTASTDGNTNEIRDSDLDPLCTATAITLGENIFQFCDEPPDGPALITPAMVSVALAQVKPPAAQLEVQPANGRTLVNFDTNFFTTLAPFDTSLPMLGRTVDLHLVPSAFAWRFGDGGASTTAEPGAPYPALDVTHRYLTKGHVAPSVEVTWSATYRVDGGPWAPVPGTVTVAGPPVDLQVLTATPTLVGYRAH